MIYTDKDPSLKTYLIQLGLLHLKVNPSPGEADNWWGAKSEASYQAFLANRGTTVLASTFADPMDIAAFKACKQLGHSDMYCFSFGDNGIGFWGDDTTGPDAQVALPPEFLEGRPNGGHNNLLTIIYKDSNPIQARVTDHMPHVANIKNGARIDLNPVAASQLGIPTGSMVPVTWRWV